jgi:hypothetical protein
MSFQITTAMVAQFSANVMHLSQQKESRLRQYCRMETQNSETAFYDRIGTRSARRKEGRHSDVVYTDTPHSRRMVSMEDFYDADLVDKEDKLRIIMNPESEYAIAIARSLARQQDTQIIEGALGNAYEGKSGGTTTALPSTQKIVAFDGATATGVGLNVGTLRAVRKKFKQAEAIQKGEVIVFAMAAQQADDLLGSTEVTSSDFATVKALVNGEVDTFMGFKFVETELLPFTTSDVTYTVTDGTYGAGAGTLTSGEGRRCLAFTAKRGVLCAIGSEVKGRVDELPSKHYSHQVYGSLSIGVTRMEEEQVVEVLCYEV